MLRSFILTWAITPFVFALAPPLPTVTDAVNGGDDIHGFSPKPTTAPGQFDLKRRQQSAIGYVSLHLFSLLCKS
jgi:hypothetical protein